MSPLKPNPYLAKLLVCADAVLAVELINTSAGSCSLLLSCVERMAFGTDIDFHIALCALSLKSSAAGTLYCASIVVGMNCVLHYCHLFTN